MFSECLLIGYHLVTWHSQPGFNDVNPGKYCDAGTAIYGTYYNSERRQSFYLGRNFQGERFGIMAGGVTGYAARPILPAIVPSYRVKISDSLYLKSFLLLPANKNAPIAVSFAIEKIN